MNIIGIGSRLNHYRWPDGSISPGSPILNYAQACALYEIRRRLDTRLGGPVSRITLEEASDGLGYFVGGDSWDRIPCRATPGNRYPHPGDVEVSRRQGRKKPYFRHPV